MSDYYWGCNCEQNSPCSHRSHVLWRDVSDGVTSDMWRVVMLCQMVMSAVEEDEAGKGEGDAVV